MNQFGIYTWKCHKETLCVAILNRQECLFFFFNRLENRRVLGGTRGRGDEGKGYGRMSMLCTRYVNGKMMPVETIPGTGWGLEGEGDKGEW
jgi:hypothetical protein